METGATENVDRFIHLSGFSTDQWQRWSMVIIVGPYCIHDPLNIQ
jgi:hypothetical protein